MAVLKPCEYLPHSMSVMTEIRNQREGKTLMKNETFFTLITEQPSNFAPGIAIFCFLPSACWLRMNSTYRVLVHWLEIVKCKGFFCVGMYLVNTQVKILLNNSTLIWFNLLALCWKTSALIKS